MRMSLLCVWISVSKVLSVEDAVALAEDLVPLGSEVEVLADIAHIEELLVVLLEEAAWGVAYMGLIQT